MGRAKARKEEVGKERKTLRITQGDCVPKHFIELRHKRLGGEANGEMIELQSLEGECSKSGNIL